MLHAAVDGVQTIRILSDDTDVFVLLVNWTSRMRVVDTIQMEKWNDDVLDVNKTIEQLGLRKCSQLRHALSGCNTVSYPFGKGKKSAIKLREIDIPGLDQVLGQPDASHAQLKATADSFFLPLYGQKNCTAMSDAHDRFFRGRKKPTPLKKLPPTDANLQLQWFGLTCRCYFERQWINGTRQKKLETLPTLMGASADPSSLRRYQQLQLLLKHFWM